MIPVYYKPTIQYVVEEAVTSGIEDIIIITGRHKRSLEDHFDKYYELEHNLQKAGKQHEVKQIRKITNLVDICYVRQKERNSLGDAIKCGERHIGKEPFAVLLGDSITKGPTPCTKQLIDVYIKYDAFSISFEEVPLEKVERYAIPRELKLKKTSTKSHNWLKSHPTKSPIKPCNHGQICPHTCV